LSVSLIELIQIEKFIKFSKLMPCMVQFKLPSGCTYNAREHYNDNDGSFQLSDFEPLSKNVAWMLIRLYSNGSPEERRVVEHVYSDIHSQDITPEQIAAIEHTYMDEFAAERFRHYARKNQWSGTCV
jgi:hypothetical protein